MLASAASNASKASSSSITLGGSGGGVIGRKGSCGSKPKISIASHGLPLEWEDATEGADGRLGKELGCPEEVDPDCCDPSDSKPGMIGVVGGVCGLSSGVCGLSGGVELEWILPSRLI